MRRKLFTIILSLILLTGSVMVVSAEEGAEHPARFVDDAYLLSEEQGEALNDKLDEISERQNCDVCIVTVNSLGNKTSTEFADDYYDYNGYGLGKNYDGIMLVLSMEDRDWAITTCGYGITAFTDAGQEYIMDRVLPSLGEDDYVTGFDKFANQCDIFIEQARTDKPYDKGHMPDSMTARAYVMLIIPCFIAALIISFVKRSRKKKSLKMVKKKAGAREYIGSVDIREKRDKFLYDNVVRVPLDDDDDGGSSTHTSSSGRTHGGSSGKF
ncbi:MAG: TPM domain-containing protein [Clostridiales bacterium]|nr:TPM domain-containing protein [Clostridiales bacterium]